MRTLGKYRLVEHLASGGMADVWRAEMPGPEGFVKEVALKLVRGEPGGDAALERMFVQEARLASRLAHANLVHVFGFDVVDGRYALAMELVRGRTLRAVLDRCREAGVRFGLARAVHVAAEVARGLAYAHRLEDGGRPAGLVHRDVSPQNVLVSYEGEVKLADFGIARTEGALEQTRPGVIKGKLAYMAPEQARGEPVDARADVFALGVVLWEMCSGRRLFARDSDAATLAAILNGDPVSRPSEWNEEVPPELDDLVLRAVERDPARRLASADELAAVLGGLRLRLARGPDDLDLRALMGRLWPEGEGERAASREPTAVREQAPAGAAAAPEPTAATRTAARPRRAGPLAVGIAAVAIAAGILVVRATARRGSTATSTGTAPPTSTATSTGTATSTATPAATSTATPAATSTSTSSPPATATSSAASAEPAVLTVHAFPWATVWIDGAPRGDTPVVVELPPGRHRVRAAHPSAGATEEELQLAPGERRLWRPRLAR